MARAWHAVADPASRSGPPHADLELLRWGPGGREHFGDPRPGDRPGTEPQQQAPSASPSAPPARPGASWRRFHGIVARLLAADPADRARMLAWASARAAEMVSAGDLTADTAEKVLCLTAGDIGLVADIGPEAVLGIIAAGLRHEVAA